MRVFISYSHDSEAHSEAVLQLAQQLRESGIDVMLDRFVPAPTEGWPRWMMAQVEAADVVLVVCTPLFCRRFEGRETPGKGKGATFEGLLAVQDLYDANTINKKLVPVIFAGSGEADIPAVLRPYTRYSLPDQFEALYRHLTDQPEIVAAPLGPRKVLPPRTHAAPATSSQPVLDGARQPALAPANTGNVTITVQSDLDAVNQHASTAPADTDIRASLAALRTDKAPGDLTAERERRRLAIWKNLRAFADTHSQTATSELLHSLASLGAISAHGVFIPLPHVLAWVRFEWRPDLRLSVVTSGTNGVAITPWTSRQSAAEILVELEHNLYEADVLGGRLEAIVTEEIFTRLAELALLAAEVRLGPPPIDVGVTRSRTRSAHSQVSKILSYPETDWVITEFGLEYVLHSYPIEANRLNNHRWVIDMSKKTWVDISSFENALDAARHLHSILSPHLT